MKTLFITVTTILVLGAGVFWAFSTGKLDSVLPEEIKDAVGGTLPDYFGGDRGPILPPSETKPGIVPVEEPAWTIDGVGGVKILVKQFATSSDANPPAENRVLFGTTNPLSEFLITYTASDKSFNISLFKEPLKEVRKRAEEEFLAILGITEGEACHLKYELGTTYWVNEFYGGKNLGFSFCPGAIGL